ncbi:unnamed protein product [Commensalibacter papalotli (ex Botero et al. 2024)]|uniref:Uncharacterized protein n=2 Tax=Commensalibacter papalotli (ex Botero et al. 2024) TaxID=2972766 RepID=A0ABN8W6L6_9PROT|nr:unnamed protein product [Commensalibacter papalotli (ex Botero et al. 2024)]CAI3929621.1 unnamed protein product [Commensalibacter papalotli (ex Botero et al. 2024)]
MIFIMSLIVILPSIFIFFVIRNKFRNLDIFLSASFFMLCIYYGSSNDFFIFFFGLFILICLLFVSVAIIFNHFKENKSVRNLIISVFLIICAPVAAITSSKLYPYSIFYQWVLFHPMQFEEAKGQEGFLYEIDSWGFAGMDSSLMLASSQSYNLSVSDDLKLWKMKNKIVCDVSRVYKVYPNLYTIFPYTNAECYKKDDIYK